MSIKANPYNVPSGYEPNVLDTYNSTTYHIKLYMISDDKLVASDFSADGSILIAESGITADISITNLSLTSFVAPNKTYRSTTHQKIEFTLKEFYGAKLLDILYENSLELGLANYYRAPFVLDISFYGQDDDGKTVKLNDIDNLTIPFIINTIDAELSTSGTSYDVTAYSLNNASEYDEKDTIKQTTSIKDVTTFGELIKKVEEKLNKDEEKEKANSTSVPCRYRILVDDLFVPFKLDESPVLTKNSDSEESVNDLSGFDDLNAIFTASVGQAKILKDDTGLTVEKTKKKTYTVSAGTKISNVIDRYLICCPEYQNSIKSTSETDNKDSDRPNDLKVMHRIVSKCNIIDYDTLSGSYAKEYVFHIIPYESASLITSGKEEKDVDPKALYKTIKSKDMVKKYFSYVFTGLNDQVISLDLKFNNAWKLYGPINAGRYLREESFNDANSNITGNNEAALAKYESISGSYGNDIAMPKRKIDPHFIGMFMPEMYMGDNDGVGKPVANISNGSVLANALLEQSFKGLSDNILNSEITIKGDPYWIGKEYSSDEIDKFDMKEAYFFLRIQQPKLPDENTGFTQHSDSGFSGLYYVTRINSNFSDGKFTQTLTSHLNFRIPLEDIEDE